MRTTSDLIAEMQSAATVVEKVCRADDGVCREFRGQSRRAAGKLFRRSTADSSESLAVQACPRAIVRPSRRLLV